VHVAGGHEHRFARLQRDRVQKQAQQRSDVSRIFIGERARGAGEPGSRLLHHVLLLVGRHAEQTVHDSVDADRVGPAFEHREHAAQLGHVERAERCSHLGDGAKTAEGFEGAQRQHELGLVRGISVVAAGIRSRQTFALFTLEPGTRLLGIGMDLKRERLRDGEQLQKKRQAIAEARATDRAQRTRGVSCDVLAECLGAEVSGSGGVRSKPGFRFWLATGSSPEQLREPGRRAPRVILNCRRQGLHAARSHTMCFESTKTLPASSPTRPSREAQAELQLFTAPLLLGPSGPAQRAGGWVVYVVLPAKPDAEAWIPFKLL
jgi:hypothetical protein